MTPRAPFAGPAVFSYGFRPFFLAATVFAVLILPLWWSVWRGGVVLDGPFAPTDWHAHEMIFGYGAAVVAGFLFTAVPNWTGRLPTRGWPLAVLLALWLAGRLSVAGLIGLGPVLVLLVDQVFLLAVAAMIAREVVAGKNWRNLKVLVPVSLLWLANVLFHVEAMNAGTADHGRRFGMALLIFLIMLIGGRIVPSFSRNWLVQRAAKSLPTAFNRFDGVCLVIGAAALVGWVAAPVGMATAVVAGLATVLHLFRLVRWRGHATWRSPLLLMLHLAYLMVPMGLASVAASALDLIAQNVGAHVLGIGAVTAMTVAVMMRATMGHTGRSLIAGRALSIAFAFVLVAMVFRVTAAQVALGGLDGIDLAAVAWTVAFAILAWRLGPWLLQAKVAQKAVSRAAR
ncbi:NnrS family protein [Rhodovulum sp. FJ3]|uniref:NnrS family protein n=1 Tax=Rhodovulum sp. FJ3 TaxID=3079053 RepID=UPI00293DB818|nr:NnrS family protein [Rhodovulum sp. FJ3]MDV4169617.1 NnrS family protein [Rhodovulum sp. FJ3]